MRPHPITPMQIEALAAYIKAFRPEWRRTEIAVHLNEAKLLKSVHNDAQVLTAGALQYALTAGLLEGLGEPGPHWRVWGFEDSDGVRHAASAYCGECQTIHDPNSPCAPPPEELPLPGGGHVQAARDQISRRGKA